MIFIIQAQNHGSSLLPLVTGSLFSGIYFHVVRNCRRSCEEFQQKLQISSERIRLRSKRNLRNCKIHSCSCSQQCRSCSRLVLLEWSLDVREIRFQCRVFLHFRSTTAINTFICIQIGQHVSFVVVGNTEEVDVDIKLSGNCIVLLKYGSVACNLIAIQNSIIQAVIIRNVIHFGR